MDSLIALALLLLVTGIVPVVRATLLEAVESPRLTLRRQQGGREL